MKDTRKLILKFLFLLPIPLVMALVNYQIDPANLFHPDYVNGIVDLLLKGNNVANITNCSERALQKSFLEKDGAPRDLVVMGSSRTLEIHSESFSEKSVYNTSVPSATIEDYMALYEILRLKHNLPSELIIGWDPWALRNNKNMLHRWEELQPFYSLSTDRLSPDEGQTSGRVSEKLLLQKYQELFSPTYLRESLQRLRDGHRRDDYFPTSLPAIDEPNVAVRRSDGSLSYDRKHRLLTREEVFAQVSRLDRSRPALSLLGSFEDIDPMQKDKIEHFIDSILGDRIKVYFLLLPYHQIAYHHFQKSNEYRIVFEAQAYFQDLAVRKGIPLFGSFNPDDLSLEEGDFYDEMHLRGTSMANLIKKMDTLFAERRRNASIEP